jgi:hypothetical protein
MAALFRTHRSKYLEYLHSFTHHKCLFTVYSVQQTKGIDKRKVLQLFNITLFTRNQNCTEKKKKKTRTTPSHDPEFSSTKPDSDLQSKQS